LRRANAWCDALFLLLTLVRLIHMFAHVIQCIIADFLRAVNKCLRVVEDCSTDHECTNSTMAEKDSNRSNTTLKKLTLLLNCTKTARNEVDISKVQSVEVSGCGIIEANGTYVKTGMRDGAPEFMRLGKWEEKVVHFFLSYSFTNEWSIYAYTGELARELYYCRVEGDGDIGPFNKAWKLYFGVAPPPKLEAKEFL
jgi:hypothetical protein